MDGWLVSSLGQPGSSPFLSPVLCRKRVGFGDGKRVWNDGVIYLFVRSFIHSIVRSVVGAGLLGSTCFDLFGLVWFGLVWFGLVCVNLIRHVCFLCVCEFRMGVARFVGLGVFLFGLVRLVCLVWFVLVGLGWLDWLAFLWVLL